MTELTPSRFAAGAAYIDGRYMPVGEASIPLTDWGYRPGQSGEARIFLIQDDNLTAEVPLRRSILQSTLRQKYRSTGRHNPQRDGGPEKGLYRLHPIALGLRGRRAADQIEHGFGLFQRPGQRVGVTLVGRMDPGRHDHAGIEIDGVLRLIREVRGAILHPGDARRGISRRSTVLSAFGAKHNSLYVWNTKEAQHLVFLPRKLTE